MSSTHAPFARRTAGLGVLVLLAALTMVVAPSTARAADGASGKLLLMLDASGSMNDPDPSGVSKLAAAQKALSGVVDALPDSAVVGLRVYGATVDVPAPTAQSCADSQLIAPIAPLDRNGLKAAVASFKAVGDTPIAHALGEGVKDLGATGKRNIVLVSDGEENCVPDPCPAVRALVAAGVDLQIDTVGFGVGDKARQQLQCVADAGRGTYYDAKDAAALSASLGKLSQRALRPFTISGTPVHAADAPEAGPVLTPGQYTDSFTLGAAPRYYKLTRAGGSTLRVSATSRPPGKGWDVIFEEVALKVTTPTGETCADDREVRTDLRSDALAVVAKVVVRGTGSTTSKACANATDLVLAVNRPKGVDGAQPMEIVVSEEPPVTDAASLPPAASGAELAPVLAPAAEPAQRVTGGGSFSDAAAITPGTYTDTLLPGEQIFYKVHLEFGQRAAFTVDAPTPGQALDLGNFAVIYLSVNAWSPARIELTRHSGKPDTLVGLLQNTLTAVLGESTAPVRYRNREAVSGAVAESSTAGDYYFAIGRSRAKASEPKESVRLDVRVRVAVTGEPSGQPTYATAGGVSGPGATSSVTGSTTGSATTGTPPVLAAEQQATDGSRSSSMVWAIAGVVLLFAAGILGGVVWRRRRDSTDGGQPGGGSQA